MTGPTKTRSDPWSRLAAEVAQTALLRTRVVDNAGLEAAMGMRRAAPSDRTAVLVVKRGTLRFTALLEILYKEKEAEQKARKNAAQKDPNAEEIAPDVDTNDPLVPILWREPLALKTSWANRVRAILASECNAVFASKPWLPKLLARLREDETTSITERRLLHHLTEGHMHLSLGLQCLAALNSSSLAEIGLMSSDALLRARKEAAGDADAGVILKFPGALEKTLDFTNLRPNIGNQDEVVQTAQKRSSATAKNGDTADATASKGPPSARSRSAKPKRASSDE